MTITKKALPRRAFLRGAGAAIALPLLDAMAPAMTALAASPARPVRRLGFVYIPMGAHMPDWTPPGSGKLTELSPILRPIAPVIDQVTVLTNLELKNAYPGTHATSNAAFLSAAANRAHLDAALDAAARAWPAVTADSFLAALDLGRPHHDARPSAFWTLDPIDGTKGFLRGGQYAVCLAFIQNGAPALGVLGCPNLPVAGNPELPDPIGSTYFALRDGGAFELPGIAPDTPARRLPTERNPAAPIRVARSVEKAHSDASITDRLLAQADIAADSLRIDSQCKYALLAAARADIYLRVPTSPARRELIWDHAAGALIAAEAGITVSDLAGKPLDFSQGRRLEENTGILAARPDLHPRLLDAVRSLRPSAA